MFCQNCGADLGNDPGIIFCDQCGYQIEGTEQKESGLIDAGSGSEVKLSEVTKKNSQFKKIFGISFAVIFVFIISIGMYIKSNANCKVTVKAGVCSVKEGIFQKKEDLTGTITIPEGTFTIERQAFKGCKNISKVIFNSSLGIVGEEAFSGCKNMNEVIFNDSLRTIGKEAFSGCKNLNEVIFNSSLETIGDGAFDNCQELKYVELPENLKHIGNRAFYKCESLTEVGNMDKLLNILGEETFYETPFWESIPVFSQIQSISDFDSAILMRNTKGSDTFYTNLNNFINSIKEIEDAQVGILDDIYYMTNYSYDGYGKASVLKVLSNNDTIKIPDYIRGSSYIYKVDKVSFAAFAWNDLKTVILPDDVRELEDVAFAVCRKLETFDFPEGLERWGDNCFESCESLNNVVIPEGIDTIPSDAFRGCSSLTNISFPESVTTIYNWAFYETPLREHMLMNTDDSVYVNNILLFGANQSSIDVKDGTTIIAAEAFADCDNVRTVKLPSSVEAIRPLAFSGCENLETISLNNVESIGLKAFFNCRNLRDIQITNATFIADEAFKNCKSLDSITIPEGVSGFSKSVFDGSGLQRIIIPSSMIPNVTLPSNIEIIPY